MEINLNTLGDLKEHEYRLSVCCTNMDCNAAGKFRNLDLDMLIERLGADQDTLAPELSKKLKCSVCGRKQMQFTLSPPVLRPSE
jgi:hypothetical protein